MTKKFLFACGVGRSGTTALCEALNLHDKIVMGVERYKYLMISSEVPQEPKALFEKERFFDYRPEDTNIRLDAKGYASVYEAAREKFNDAVYVGDKTPGLYKKLPALKNGFPGCKVIYILRLPDTVAFSWQNRADKGHPSWPAKNGYEAAVTAWNRSMQIVERHKQEWGDNLILLNYETTFGAQAKTLFPRLLDRLGLGADLNPALDAFLDKSIKAAAHQRDIPQHIRDHVAENANMLSYERVRALTD
jgi:hypothetical protein